MTVDGQAVAALATFEAMAHQRVISVDAVYFLTVADGAIEEFDAFFHPGAATRPVGTERNHQRSLR